MQLLLYLSLVALLGASQVQAGAVFAHFMVGTIILVLRTRYSSCY